MGLRGPKSKTNIRVLDPVKKRRPNPLKGMSKSARNIWLRTVRTYPPDFFSNAQLGLLKAYCEAEASLDIALKEIRKNGQCIKQDNGIQKRSPWAAERDSLIQVMASLSTKLKLNDKQAPQVRKPKSKWDGLLFNGKK